MEDNNLAQSTVSAEEIHEMANAAREMAASFNSANNELTKTMQYMAKLSAKGGTGGFMFGGATNLKEAKQQIKQQQQLVKEQTKLAQAQAKLHNAKHKERTAKYNSNGASHILNQLSSGSIGKLTTLLKFGQTATILGTLVAVGKRLIQTGEQLRKTYEGSQKTLSALGQDSKNLDTILHTTTKEQGQLKSSMSTLSTVFGAVGTKIINAFERGITAVAKLIPSFDKLETAISGINRRQAISGAQYDLIGSGLNYKASGAVASNIEAAAVAYLMRAYDISETEARNNPDYQSTVQTLQGLVKSGGSAGMFNTTNVEGYGYANQIWQPGVHYTDAYMTAMRGQMLADALDIYKEGGAAGLADWNNRMGKMQTLVGNIANSLYSFDEVEQLNATNLEDLDGSVQDLGTLEETINSEDQNNKTQFFDTTHDDLEGLKDAVAEAATAVVDAIDRKNLNVTVMPAPVYAKADEKQTATRPYSNPNYAYNTVGAMAGATAGVTEKNKSTQPSTRPYSSPNYSYAGAGVTADNLNRQPAYEALSAFQDYIQGVGHGEYEKVAPSFQTIKDAIYSAKSQADLDAITSSLSNAHEGYKAGNIQAVLDGCDKINNVVNKVGYFDAMLLTGSLGFGFGAEALAGASAGAGAGALSSFGAQLATLLTSGRGFATGGIGTSKVTNATLFENGPEAVIPLTSDIGKTFMAESISQALELSYAGGDTINVHIDGPVFTENERQLNHWAEQLGDRYAQVKARRGGK